MSETAAAVLSRRAGVTIEVDRPLCFGAGDCADTAPSVFELDAEQKAVVIGPEAEDLDRILEAAENCPVNAIIVTDAETGEQVYP